MVCFPHDLEPSSAWLRWVWEYKRKQVGNEVEEDGDGYLYEDAVKEKGDLGGMRQDRAVMQRATSSASST